MIGTFGLALETRTTLNSECCEADQIRRLVTLAQRYDKEAMTEIYELYFDRIYRYIYIKTGDQVDSQDIAQNVFLKAFTEIQKYRWTAAPFSSWLYRIAHNQVVDRVRRKIRRDEKCLDDNLSCDISQEDDIQSGLEKRTSLEQMVASVKKLTPLQQEVIALRFACNLPLAEVAKIMDRTVGSIKALQHSALVMLRKKMLADRS
jgi:RNA polymerase sigma-70 factor (ECF subfamily)